MSQDVVLEIDTLAVKRITKVKIIKREELGIAPDELSEEKKAIEDIMSRFKESEAMAQKESNAKAKKGSQDATRGEEMRLTLCFSLYQKTTF